MKIHSKFVGRKSGTSHRAQRASMIQMAKVGRAEDEIVNCQLDNCEETIQGDVSRRRGLRLIKESIAIWTNPSIHVLQTVEVRRAEDDG